MGSLMDFLKGYDDAGESKSYFMGYERGLEWAEDFADYFDLKDWSAVDEASLENLELPEEEEQHFLFLSGETPLEYFHYKRGWLSGVRHAKGDL
jgi:hypothetical protein